MDIKINHIAKMEGHAGFMASVLDGDVKSAKLEVQEGIRLIEGVLIGRYYTDMPIIAQRICGICPVVHNLTSIKALENAMGVKVTPETEKLRAVMELAQIIHSHALHLFFLSLADFLDMDNDIQLISTYPEETKIAVRLREFGMDIVRVIGGRVIHPLTNEVGGFKKAPEAEALRKIVVDSERALQDAVALGEFFKKIKIPNFRRETEYVCLTKKGQYAVYDGDIVSSYGLHIPVEKFEQDFQELQKQDEVIKKVEHNGISYMVGAIARININRSKLNPQASRYLESLNFTFPDYNPFHNILCQMVELIHCVEESTRLIKELLNSDLEKVITRPYEIAGGVGVAAVEAPRGTLYYHVDVDDKGYVKNVNIITPTAQFLANLEDDVAEYIKEIINLKDQDKQKKLRGFIRAYDPCISCAVH
ncbi:MAG: Ni/Fe hydrogenase subunit alpha [Candidatus Moranbacteria bacterium]|nr:Ni/Fe hydrogenase subunit alpha [bacterium]MDP1834104.1 Ni/Fe hydrogenase subunit alpha [Candidatus Moranbacteria bacterium]